MMSELRDRPQATKVIVCIINLVKEISNQIQRLPGFEPRSLRIRVFWFIHQMIILGTHKEIAHYL